MNSQPLSGTPPYSVVELEKTSIVSPTRIRTRTCPVAGLLLLAMIPIVRGFVESHNQHAWIVSRLDPSSRRLQEPR